MMCGVFFGFFVFLNDVCFEDGGAHKKTGGRAGDANIYIGSNQDGQDWKCGHHQRDISG